MSRYAWLVIICALSVALAGCSNGGPVPTAVSSTPQNTFTPALTPYRSATPELKKSPTQGASPTLLPTMTPTPLSYKVVKGDDMFGIALRHGISLPVLLTANPTVNPSFLSVGTVLQIPQFEATPKPGESTPMPIPVELSAPVCYPTGEGGLWCLTLASNTNERSVENLSATILVAGGETGLQQQTAYALVYLLPPGSSIGLGAYFPPPAPHETGASASLAAAFYQPEDDVRYVAVSITDQESTVQPGGLAAQVSGTLRLEESTNQADEFWVLATAYDADGNPVGLRRWESHGPLTPGETIQFDFLVYSLGPEISRVELLAEGHTALGSQETTLTTTPTIDK